MGDYFYFFCQFYCLVIWISRFAAIYRLVSLVSISEYLDEAMLILKNTSVLTRRVPGRPRMPIVTEPVIEQDEYYLNP